MLITKEYLAFKRRYIKMAMMKHYKDPNWDTKEKVIGRLNGYDGIERTYFDWLNLNTEQQYDLFGFSTFEVDRDL